LQSGHKIIITLNNNSQENVAGIDSSTTKCSVRGHGKVAGYAVNTHQGIVRGYNEDRVSIVLNIMKPPNRPDLGDEQWPKCSFFGVYDGHGGAGCADFLRD
jgi:protein phosphatase PTC2/3